MFWRKRELEYLAEIKELYKELNQKNDLILELLEREQKLQSEICDKNSKLLEWMKMAVEFRMKKIDTKRETEEQDK